MFDRLTKTMKSIKESTTTNVGGSKLEAPPTSKKTMTDKTLRAEKE